MDRVITYSLPEDFIQNLAAFVEENFLKSGRDISRLLFVFGGKRPALFLKKALSEKAGKSFFSPAFFSIEEFVEYIVAQKGPFVKIPDIDACHLIFKLTRDIAPGILKGREKFSRFLPWAREILAFIEQLDLEDIKPKALKNIQLNAAIGYEVPESINAMLEHVISLREAYHAALNEKRAFSRGLMYLSASKMIADVHFDQFDHIFFCNLFYLHKTEREIIKHIYDRGRALLFFQGDGKEWPVLRENARRFSCPIEPQDRRRPAYNLSLYSGFDTQAQVCLVREVLKTIKKLDKTVIVLPDPDSLIPLLSEIASRAGEFNVSLGYPFKRSSLHALLELVFAAQGTRKEGLYYTRDYLKVLRHPLVKNLKISFTASVTRVLIHKIEEVLLGTVESPLGGSLFVNLDDIRNSKPVYEAALDTLGTMEVMAGYEELEETVAELHNLLFQSWEGIDNLEAFSAGLEKLLDRLVKGSNLGRYPLNLKIADRLFTVGRRLRNSACKKEPFPREDIFKIVENVLEKEVVSFSGSPLKGLQILGLFETRSLNFENVIIVDVNESVLPRLRIYEPLIPREVMLSLGLNRLEKEEEIQRYQFLRLISSAKNVHLIYEESKDKEKSRFIEELLWARQKELHSLEAVSAARARFEVKVLPRKAEVKKKPEVMEFLRGFEYSATSVDTYLRCPLRFYYQYGLGLKESEELREEPEGAEVGSFVHALLEDTFRKFIGRKPRIDQSFRKYFFGALEEKFAGEFQKRMKSGAFLLKETLKFRLSRFLDQEEEREVEKILCLEENFARKIRLSNQYFKFRARIDRIDKLEDGKILIIDYKTGSSDPRPKSPDRLEEMDFSRESIKDSVRSFQLPLYLYLAEGKKYKNEKVNAALYNLRTTKIDHFLNQKDFSQKEKIMDRCIQSMQFIIEEILNPEVSFKADDRDARYCNNCPFFYLCR